ncbi:MAG: type II toxin-antitoxin system Phd/YefM family antitoxin [Firmicutes bacterium]|nr:type II toxin-antitoxin system Phd/YefM family antitoxin [Bacillota bacterium]
MEVTSTEIQNNFGTYLKLAQVEDVYITRNGKQIAVLQYRVEDHDGSSGVAESNAAYQGGNQRMTVEEFRKLSDSSENRYELIDGEVFQLASPSYEHQRVLVAILSRFHQWSQEKRCKPVTAPFDVTLFKDERENIVQPDIVVVCDPEKVNDRGRYQGIPTLVVEVLSESTQNKDMLKKLNLYMAGGIGEYWIVNPWNREVYIYSFASGEIQNYRVYKGSETAGSEVLENLCISLEQVFSKE